MTLFLGHGLDEEELSGEGKLFFFLDFSNRISAMINAQETLLPKHPDHFGIIKTLLRNVYMAKKHTTNLLSESWALVTGPAGSGASNGYIRDMRRSSSAKRPSTMAQRRLWPSFVVSVFRRAHVCPSDGRIPRWRSHSSGLT